MDTENLPVIDAQESQDHDKGTILIVDDLPDNLHILNEILPNAGYNVQSALNGALALISAKNTLPDLILLDIKMPEMDGFEVCRRLKADSKTRHIPIIFLSAITDNEFKVRGLKVGGVDFVSKPFENNELLARVETHMELQNMKKQLEAQNSHLREMAQLREEVEHITHHDLKGPLTPMLNYPRMIRKSGPLTEKQEKYLSTIENAGMIMLQLVNRTMDLFCMEKGNYQLKSVPVDIIQIIENIIEEQQHTLKNKDLKIIVSLNGNPIKNTDNFTILGEQLLCYIMLDNLIKNALEASSGDQQIHISMKQNHVYHIAIHNESAVTQEIRDTFFDKYTTAGKNGGTGLGTYSAKLAAETQGGTIRMTTSEAEGTTVTISFPMKEKLPVPARQDPDSL